MNLRRGMVRGAFSLGSTRVVGNVLGALSIIVLARLLTPDDFAIVAIASSVLSLVQSCTELSLGSALVSKPQVSRSQIDTAWTMALLRSAVIAAIFLVFAWPLARIYETKDLFPVLLVSGLTGAAAGLQNPLIVQVTRDMRFWPVAITQLVQKGLSLGFAIVLALSLHSYWAIIAGNALGAILASLLTYFLVPYLPRFSLRHWREIWSFSGWLFFKQLCETLNWRGDQLIIGAVVPGAQFGVYAMADNLAVIPSRESIHPVRQALFPGLANIGNDPSRLRNAVLRAQSTAAMVIAPFGILLALLADPAVRIALGEQWLSAIPYVQIIALLYTFGCFSIALQPLAMAQGKTRVLFLQQAVALVVKLPMLLAGLMAGGLLGAAIARCLAEFVSMIVELVAMRFIAGIRLMEQVRAHAVTVLGLAAMSAGVSAVHQAIAQYQFGALTLLALEGAIGSVLYLTAIAIAWMIGGRKEGPVTELLSMVSRMTSSIHASPLSRHPRTETAG